MTIPTSPAWNVLYFPQGSMDLGPAGEGWFVTPAELAGSGEGFDWEALVPDGAASRASGTPGAEYFRGPDNTYFSMVAPGPFGPPTTQRIRLLNFPVAAESVAQEVTVGFTAILADLSFDIHAVRSSDSWGNTVRLYWDNGAGTWSAQWYNPATSAFETFASPTPVGLLGFSSFSVRTYYDGPNNTLHVWINDTYYGSMTGRLVAGVSSPAVGLTYTPTWLTTNVLSWKVSTRFGGDSLRPVADAGPDHVSPLGRWIGFDGSRSTESSGADLHYDWKIIGAPSESSRVYMRQSCTVLGSIVTSAGAMFNTEASVGDIAVLGGSPFVINTVISPTQIQVSGIPSVVSGPVQIIKQSGLEGTRTFLMAFSPDVKGLYLAQLTVMGPSGRFSQPSLSVASVGEDITPLGVPLDYGFLWDYLGDFWQVVQGTEWVADFWSALARTVGAYQIDLWNTDFNKSLGTIQEVVQRRWLPYHPRLPETNPDGVRFERRMAPVIGSIFLNEATILNPAATLPLDDAFTITLYTESGPQVLTVSVPAGTTLQDVPGKINDLISAEDPVFHAVSFSWRLIYPAAASGFSLVGWTSGCAVSISDTLGLISVAPVFSLFTGSGAVRMTDRIVRLPLVDLDQVLGVGDLLNLGSRPYEVVSFTSYTDPITSLVYLDVEVNDEIPDSAPASMMWAFPSYWISTSTDWWAEGVTPGDLLTVLWRPSGSSSAPFSPLVLFVSGSGALKVGGTSTDILWSGVEYRLDSVRRFSYIRVGDDVLGIPRLQEAPDSPTWVMEEFRHYVVGDRRGSKCIVLDFRSEPPSQIETGGLVRNTANLAFLRDDLWGEVTYLDNRPIVESNFGRMVGAYAADFESSSRINYLSVARVLWFLHNNGPTPANLNRAAMIASGYPYAEASGTVVQAVEDFYPGYSYVLVRDDEQGAIVRCYVFVTGKGLAVNPSTGVAYTSGDHLNRFDILVQGQAYYDYINDPEWWENHRISGLEEPYKIHHFGIFLDPFQSDSRLWGLVLDFILEAKKTHTYPIFAGSLELEDNVSISDDLQLHLELVLSDSLRDFPVPFTFDHPRLGSGLTVIPNGDPGEAVMFRMTTPGFVGSPPVRVSLRAGAALNVVVVGNDVNIEYVRGVTTPAEVVNAVNGDPGANSLVTAFRPAAWGGGVAVNSDFGPMIVNHRGRVQSRYDLSSGPCPGTEGLTTQLALAGPSSAVSDDMTVNVLGVGSITAPTGAAPYYRLTLSYPAVPPAPQFHDDGTWFGGPPASGQTPTMTQLRAEEDWVAFYKDLGGGVGSFTTFGKIVGVNTDTGFAIPWGFGPGTNGAAGTHYIDVLLDPSFPALDVLKQYFFHIYRGSPFVRVADWSTMTSDTILSSAVGSNVISAVAGAGPSYTISVAGGMQFANLVSLNTALVGGGVDYLVFYDANGALMSYATFDGVGVVGTDADVTLTPAAWASALVPQMGWSFIVVRRPVYTDLTYEFYELANARYTGHDRLAPGSTITIV